MHPKYKVELILTIELKSLQNNRYKNKTKNMRNKKRKM